MARHLIARIDLPELARDEVKVEVRQTHLLISAGPKGLLEARRHHEGEKHLVYWRDRATSSYFRSILLPEGVRVEDIEAKFEDGILEVSAFMPDRARLTEA